MRSISIWAAACVTAIATGCAMRPANLSEMSLTATSLPAAGLDGRWEGGVQPTAQVVLRVGSDRSGATAWVDLPPQAGDLPASALTRDGAVVRFSVAGYAMTFEGVLSADGSTLTGALTQLGRFFPLTLTHTSLDASPTHLPVLAQTPQKPYPYKEEDVAFDNPAAPGVRLACSLTSPSAPGPYPAAVLLSGSGPTDRDATDLGRKAFLVLADHLTRSGIAVLRCDDRGVGESTGDFNKATLEDFVSDADAAFAFMRARSDMDPKRIGFVGHSLGTMVGQKAAANRADAAFLVMLAAAGAPVREIFVDQQQSIARAEGAPDEFLARRAALWRKVVEIANSLADGATVKSSVFALLMAEGPAAYPNGMTEAVARSEAERMSSDYMRGLLAYDPAEALANVAAPILVINGSLDAQATPGLNLAGLRRILRSHADATVLEMPGVDHAFRHRRTGPTSELAAVEETFAPEALEEISDWLIARVMP